MGCRILGRGYQLPAFGGGFFAISLINKRLFWDLITSHADDTKLIPQ